MEKFNDKIYGVVGLRAKLANWNADFTGYPKKIDGTLFASDKALKFVIRRFLEEKGKLVFYSKKYNVKKSDKGVDLSAMSYSERYQSLFLKEDEKTKIKDGLEILKNILSCQDIRFFGTITTLKGGSSKKKNSNKNNNSDDENNSGDLSIGIRGPIQITHGINKYKKTKVFSEEIISQFSSSDDKSHSTIGSVVLVNEAHYFYGFAYNPNTWNEFKNAFEKIEDENFIPYLTEDDISLFKESILNAVDNFNSTTKAGCNNEFALFVTTDNDLYLPDLNTYIDINSNSKNVMLSKLIKYFGDIQNKNEKFLEKIKKIEIYYRPEYIGLDNQEIERLKNLFGDKLAISEF